MIGYIVTGLFLIAAASAFGQVNVEDRRLGREESGLSGSIDLQVKLERGNSELTEIGTKPKLVARFGRHQVFTLNSLAFVDADQGTIVNEGFSHLRYNYSLVPRWTWEVFTQVQYDRSQDLSRRFLLGTGARYTAVQSESISLAAGVAGMYEYEELESDLVVETARNSNYASFRYTRADRFSLSSTVYVQPAFEDPADIRVLAETELAASLSRVLTLTVGLRYRYDSEPPVGIKEYDLSLENGLRVSF